MYLINTYRLDFILFKVQPDTIYIKLQLHFNTLAIVYHISQPLEAYEALTIFIQDYKHTKNIY